jgi:hypothetical protein
MDSLVIAQETICSHTITSQKHVQHVQQETLQILYKILALLEIAQLLKQQMELDIVQALSFCKNMTMLELET